VDLDSILPGYYVSRFKKNICVYDAHEYYTESPEIVNRPRIKKIWEWVAQSSIPNIKYAYTVCESIAELLEERYGTPFQTIRNVPFQNKSETINQYKITDQNILLYQGMLNEGRGLEQMIEAMQYIENAILWLVGEGDVSAELRELVQKYSVTEKVKFWGYQNPDVLKKITQQATIGLNLLENKGLSYYYSLANKACDYIQAEIPSVNMNFPEYQRINEQYGTFILLDNLDVSHIAQQVKQLIENKEMYQKIVKNCSAAKEVFIWEKEEQKLIDFYKKIK
jgi:glycosyltransferase involved in cell wall biosynthesis